LPQGVIKVIATGGGRILGAGIAGRGAGELIGQWSLAMANGLPLAAMRQFAVPYPSRSDLSRRVAGPDGLTQPLWRRIIAPFTQSG